MLGACQQLDAGVLRRLLFVVPVPFSTQQLKMPAI